jgi:hypothetical protein
MLKTVIVYKGEKPDDYELRQLMPSLNITYIPFDGAMVTQQGGIGTQFSWAWMKTLAPGNYDVRCFMVHPEDLVKAGITTSWGLYNLDSDKVHDFYITNLGTKNLDARAKANGFRSNFAWMFVHEFLHGSVWESTRNAVQADQFVHQWEREGTLKSRLSDYYKKMDLLTQTITTLTAMLATLLGQKKTTLFHPVQWTPRIISQKYGVLNAEYPLTGRHIGTDYPLPLGTPIYAPWDGVVTTAGRSAVLGNYCFFTYTFNGEVIQERWCHLNAVPGIGKYMRGVRVAYSGNTGQSDGPHLHREGWHNEVRIDLIKKSNWSSLTFDVEALTY